MTRVNLITGFLGSGKTTLLCHLLAARPSGENWAVLVNEFGEIGIDGALLADRGATLKEIPGGCLCCVNGLPMQVGLNMLLKSKLDRLLIEPTGLGHPRQVLEMLDSPVYQSWLQLNATLTLLDARQLADPRIVANENFRDQLAAADLIIANKRDCWDQADRQRLADWQQQMQPPRPLIETEFGQIPLSLLDTPRQPRELPVPQHHHSSVPTSGLAALRLNGDTRWRRALNHGQSYSACGWLFDADTLFDSGALLEWVRQAPVERVKGVMRTTEGALRINRQANELQSETLPSPPSDSRIELIHSQQADWNRLQSALLKCRLR
ncbi:CobW family GTP-binding protein [Pantoea agglomerans]|uniref:CobW family GTP-binding protein n=1 Tax=Enterobacter agglomerans TaxID=549 RepID=UPI000E216A9B|nr:GTP-binding protein [Pantoea agglomerans]MCH9408870.1 GTP-binding protein [Pantoea agglomerans]WNK31878.1 GTP-binding protein [Pantoea agglomerans]